jgi:hypothetical protein
MSTYCCGPDGPLDASARRASLDLEIFVRPTHVIAAAIVALLIMTGLALLIRDGSSVLRGVAGS